MFFFSSFTSPSYSVLAGCSSHYVRMYACVCMHVFSFCFWINVVVNNNQIAVILIWTNCESARDCCCRTIKAACCCCPFHQHADAAATCQRTDVAVPHLEIYEEEWATFTMIVMLQSHLPNVMRDEGSYSNIFLIRLNNSPWSSLSLSWQRNRGLQWSRT